MNIKVKKEMNLPQLIEWAWENNVNDKVFYGSLGGKVEFDFRGWVRTDLIEPDETFTVEVEEEITEETVIPNLLEVYKYDSTLVLEVRKNKSIKDLLDSDDYDGVTIKAFHIINDDGTHTLIWKDGEMIK
ncbi:hypothetical protein EON06_06510 [Staphylococcus delphini]|uniref:hypothetical protein n=1 Tax=Staphylococcus delphini TaxID=53344 RepID=UPI00136233E8|nr:hypothetical protein [Staphylococcus delphini]NBK47404.1 hypothetical protein [Staphylococcus delphini]